jgi:hypothetical protein
VLTVHGAKQGSRPTSGMRNSEIKQANTVVDLGLPLMP